MHAGQSSTMAMWVPEGFFLTLLPYSVLQCAKKVVSDSSGLVDSAIGLLNSVVNLPKGQVMFFEQFE